MLASDLLLSYWCLGSYYLLCRLKSNTNSPNQPLLYGTASTPSRIYQNKGTFANCPNKSRSPSMQVITLSYRLQSRTTSKSHLPSGTSLTLSHSPQVQKCLNCQQRSAQDHHNSEAKAEPAVFLVSEFSQREIPSASVDRFSVSAEKTQKYLFDD